MGSTRARRVALGVILALGFGGVRAGRAGEDAAAVLDLAGEWSVRLDPGERGSSEGWPGARGGEAIRLPGSVTERGFGDEVSVETPWTGGIVDRSWFTDSKYERYRQPGNVKIPFWLTPERYSVGAAWYQREVTIPEAWKHQRVVLYLERCHWETTAWVDGKELGSRDSLSTANTWELPGSLPPGRHLVTLRVDNRVKVDVGENAHSVSDHTQGNFNGVVGRMELRATDPIWIENVQVFPDVRKKTARVRVELGARIEEPGTATLEAEAILLDRGTGSTAAPAPVTGVVPSVKLGEAGGTATFELSFGEDARLWDEFAPSLYRLDVRVRSGAYADARSTTFGLREIGTEGTHFTLNGQKIFLRGTLDCCIYPLTGYPPTDVESWKRVVRICKAHGLNHIRFHSWCPPEAAFQAADELGFYYHVECAAWTTVGDGKPIDGWIYAEGDRILKAYGNHPCFVLLAYGNEPGGKNQKRYLGDLVESWKAKDPRRLYTSAAGWPAIPENQFHSTPAPRIQGWGQGISSRINARPPETKTDYSDFVARYSVPVVSHEIGQWCVYPNLDEISKYTGVLKARNFEIFRDTLAANHMLDLARPFLLASGKLQTLCYKEDIESALRTPGFGGFQLLDLHDFPGQGTALVGVLDPFWDSKGYVTPQEYHRFACETVPLALMSKRVWTNDETFQAEIEMAHWGPHDLEGVDVVYRVVDDNDQDFCTGEWTNRRLQAGGITIVTSSLEVPLGALHEAHRLRLEVSIRGTEYVNDWDFWVYPAKLPGEEPASVTIHDDLDDEALRVLRAGGRVLLLVPPSRVKGDALGRIPAGFSSIFWNTAWTRRQPPHTLGILCDPEHPALAGFPTEFHSNWQWWDLVTKAHPFILDGLPAALRPIVQGIDDWFTNRRLGHVFEAEVEGGKLLACGIDLRTDLQARPVARQLRRSLLDYMAGDSFRPGQALGVEDMRGLLQLPSPMERLGGRVRADSAAGGFEAEKAIDGDPGTIWHTPWGDGAPGFPHELVVELREPVSVKGVDLLPRQDQSNGWIRDYEIFVSEDGVAWGEPAAKGALERSQVPKTIVFSGARRGRFVKLRALSTFDGAPYASLAEIDLRLDR